MYSPLGNKLAQAALQVSNRNKRKRQRINIDPCLGEGNTAFATRGLVCIGLEQLLARPPHASNCGSSEAMWLVHVHVCKDVTRRSKSVHALPRTTRASTRSLVRTRVRTHLRVLSSPRPHQLSPTHDRRGGAVFVLACFVLNGTLRCLFSGKYFPWFPCYSITDSRSFLPINIVDRAQKFPSCILLIIVKINRRKLYKKCFLKHVLRMQNVSADTITIHLAHLITVSPIFSLSWSKMYIEVY